MIITIDGPAASGKSTIARQLADYYNAFYLNSGLLYRALAYVLTQNKGYSLEDISFPDADDLLWARGICTYQFVDKGGQIFADDINITSELKTPFIDDATSRLSVVPLCRDIVLEWQRNFAQSGDLIAEGRDMGSTVFPYADYKFYITASIPVRAQRMLSDLKKRGTLVDLSLVEQSIQQRDERDMNRSIAPLLVPAGAHVIDTSDLSVEESVKKMVEIIQSIQ